MSNPKLPKRAEPYVASGAPRSPVFGLIAGVLLAAVSAVLAYFDVEIPGDADAIHLLVTGVLFSLWSGWQAKASRREQIKGVAKLANDFVKSGAAIKRKREPSGAVGDSPATID